MDETGQEDAMTTTRNQVWTVRAGTTGSGSDLFDVYAPGMAQAHDQAKANVPTLDTFTVHTGVTSAGPWKTNRFAQLALAR